MFHPAGMHHPPQTPYNSLVLLIFPENDFLRRFRLFHKEDRQLQDRNTYPEIVSFLPTSYTYKTDPMELNNVWKNRCQARDLDAFLLPYGYGDGGGGPSRDHIEYARRQKNLEGSVKVKFSEPVEFFEDMQEKGGPKNTYVGELYFTAHRGTYTSQAMVKKNNRKSEIAMRELELWSALASLGEANYPKTDIEELRRIVNGR